MRRLVLSVAVLTVALAACGGGGGSKKTSASSTTTSNSTTTTAPPTAGGGNGGSGTNGGASTPAIASFTASPAPIDCSGGSASVTLTWSTRNATGADISVDGPGVYASYGPSGSTAINFPCDGNSHTYTLTAKGAGGATARQTITVTVLPVPM